MAVSTSYTPIEVNWTTTDQAISVTWPFFAAGDIVVTEVASTGVETVKTITTHYTVSGGTDTNGLPATGTVTMVGAATSGSQIRITRSTAKTQGSEFTEGGKFPAKTVEAAFDRQMLINQESAAGGPDGITGDTLQFNSAGAVDYWDGEGHAIHDLAYVQLAEGSAPATPASGYGVIYTKTDGDLYHKNDGGTEVNLTDSLSTATTSASEAAASASAAATSETNASTSATNASNAADAAAASVAAANLPSSITGQALKVLRVNAGETAYEHVAAGGDVIGPASATNNNLVAFDATTGRLIKDSGIAIAHAHAISDVTSLQSTLDAKAPLLVAAVSVASGTNPDTLTTSGVYDVENPTGLAASYYLIEVARFSGSADYVIQRAHSLYSRVSFMRQRVAGTWGAWTRIVYADGGLALTGGFWQTSVDANGGSPVTTGTLTLDLADGNVQHYNNNGAHTLAPYTGHGPAVLVITNGASAGAITLTGWDEVIGDGDLTTVNGDKFRCFAFVDSAGSTLQITVVP